MTHASRPTLAEVARVAGVSVASASRALSGASASPAMVQRVQQAATGLGYAVDAAARSLKVRRTDQLVLAVADLGNPVYVEMMRAVEAVAKDAGYRLVVIATGNEAESVLEVVRGLDRGYADGLIAVPLRFDDALIAGLRATRVPVAVIGGLPSGTELDNVRANSARGVGLAVAHVVSGRRRRLAFLNGPADTTPGSARSRGFQRAVRNHGLTPVAQGEAADFTAAAGEKTMTEMLAGATSVPDAVVCANDLLAVGAMRSLGAAGLSVGDRVAVTGMDDTDLAEFVSPALTSVGLGSRERGLRAATLLLDRLADPSRPATRLTVQPTLVVRESSAPASRSRAGRRS